jgi:RNA polymerase sigma-70 factor (ECF subfamily)
MTDVVTRRDRPGRAADDGVMDQLEPYRTELTGYCYRMLGSSFEAEDAVQETLVRAWRGFDRFEGRAALRSWLYRIATNVCLDMVKGKQRRARPMELGPARPADSPLPAPPTDVAWIEPMPDNRVIAQPSPDPAEQAAERETIRLAFVAALQHLPPRQRAVLILREVLRWKASEVAELLDTSVASVNSALQRARATMAESDVAADHAAPPVDREQQALLERYVDAFERYDLDSLTALLHEDATMSMPPFAMWLRGRDQIRAWFEGTGRGCQGSRLIATAANGAPAFGQYRADPDGGHVAWALQILDIEDGRLTGLHSFLDVDRLFPLFGLPAHLPAEPG